MTRHAQLTDAVIRAALAPESNVAPPPGTLAAISAEVRRTPQARAGARWPWASDPGFGPRLLPSIRLVWVVAAAALLLALLAGVLAGISPLRQSPLTRLVPTGIETLTPEGGTYDRVVADGAGTLWAVGSGHLTRFDPGTGARRTWTISDDAAFDAGVVAAARAGGVWIWSGATIRRFDGDGFRDEIPAGSSSPMSLAEAPDGTLWADSTDVGLRSWDGTRWVAAPVGRPTAMAVQLLPLGRDDVWVDNPSSADILGGGPVGAGISHLVDGRWVTYDARDAPQLGGHVGSIQQAADGSIWVTMDPGASSADPGIARFDGRSWTTVDGPGFPAWWLEAAPDGSVWAVTAQASTLAVARYADGRWTTFGAADGLSGTSLGHVSATPAGVFLGTDAGLFRFTGDRWVPAWPGAGGEPGRVYGWGGRLVAVSADEAWAADDRGIWHYVGGTWVGPVMPTDLEWATVRSIALASDGTLWVATDRTVAALRDGRWLTAPLGQASGPVDGWWKIVVAPDGTAWVGGRGQSIVGLGLVGGVIETHTVTCPVASTAIAVTTDGAVYLGDIGYSSGRPGLARSDGRTCEMLDPLGDGQAPEVLFLEPDPRGGLVALLLEQTTGRSDTWTSYLVRLDGGRWTVLEERANVPGVSGSLTVTPAGQIWWADGPGGGIERFDGKGWTPVVAGISVPGPISIAPDGTAWFQGSSGIQTIRADETPLP